MKADTLKIITLFGLWRIVLFFLAFFAIFFIPWGGWFPYSETVLMPTGLPSWIWGFGNFDGVHYLKIAQNGYIANNSQAFFPLYPLVIKFLNILPRNLLLDTRVFVDPSYFYVGFIISNLAFLLALYFLYKLFRLDWKKNTVLLSISLLIFFPTSYYFGSIYTESLFLLTVVLGFYFMRKKSFLLAGLFAFLASTTKILGLLLFPALLIELYKSGQVNSKVGVKNWLNWIGLAIAPLGTFFYMVYLNINFSDPLFFLSAQPAFGAERSSVPTILLPQVIYRYIKIFLNVPFFSLSFWIAFLEIFLTLFNFIALIFLYKKMRKSYWIFSMGALIVPTLTGTFSSMPRYVLMSFFLITPFLAKSKWRNLLIVLSLILLCVLVSLFTRGYWVA